MSWRTVQILTWGAGHTGIRHTVQQGERVCLVSASQFRGALQRKALTRRLAEEGSSHLAQYAIRLPREAHNVLLFRGSQC